MVCKIEMCDCNVIHEEIVETVKEQLPENSQMDIVAEFYKIFSDSTKLKILWALEISEMCVCDLAVLINITKSAISHQLKILKESNLVKCRKEGKNAYYSLADNCVKEIIEKGIIHTINKT